MNVYLHYYSKDEAFHTSLAAIRTISKYVENSEIISNVNNKEAHKHAFWEIIQVRKTFYSIYICVIDHPLVFAVEQSIRSIDITW
jgi:hypothetical protein